MGQDLTILHFVRDILVENESLSLQQSQQAKSSIPTLDAHSFQLILETMIHGFRTTMVLAAFPDGEILFANKLATDVFADQTPQSVVGKNLADVSPQEWANERIHFFKLALDLNYPIMVTEILKGARVCSTVSPIRLKNNSTSNKILLVTVEHITPEELQNFREQYSTDQFYTAKINDLDKLEVLSPRELEILALMGQGLRQKQIAELLHRSISTVDRHRERIGEKLGITDRVELVALARKAALEITDAQRLNISKEFNRPPPTSPVPPPPTS